MLTIPCVSPPPLCFNDLEELQSQHVLGVCGKIKMRPSLSACGASPLATRPKVSWALPPHG